MKDEFCLQLTGCFLEREEEPRGARGGECDLTTNQDAVFNFCGKTFSFTAVTDNLICRFISVVRDGFRQSQQHSAVIDNTWSMDFGYGRYLNHRVSANLGAAQ